MKIAFLGNLTSIHLIRWANTMKARGHHVDALSAHLPAGPEGPDVAVHRLAIPGPAGYFLNAFQLRVALRRLDPDLLHVHFASGYGTLGSLSGYHPRILSVWGSDVYLFPRRSAFHRWLLRSTLRTADLVTSTSRAMRRRTEQLSDRQVHVVPFGIDVDQFQPVDRPEQAGAVTIGTARTLAPRYGLDLLIEAFADLVEKEASLPGNPQLRLLIVGEGPERARLQQQVAASQLQGRVEFTGWLPHDRMPAVLQRMDVFVAPSRSESFGVAVLEAAACGLPAVVSKVGGLPEVVLHEQTGLVVEANSVAALSEALARLVADPHARHGMGLAARQHVIDRYRWQDSVVQMERLYLQLLGGGLDG